ncbi:glycoside hydrolase family 2 protein [Paenibacillus nasutitermitis]|uniref:Beta-glucuronidase n=1 Tax=Paenibacillus nasutitermitis TaxID=1652958 RepID=A0A917DLT1_9BACL|nr:sugar-binding domain-containing protein [Paenibacillus nasutitermitis]GGD49535.1 beta-glucuronidase [Paenibacillus nasutitermitis]
MLQFEVDKEYPRPQFYRSSWLSLNGVWEFRFDDASEGEQAGWHKDVPGDRKIIVPYTYETKACGIGEEKFHPVVWYERELDIPADWNGKRIRLNFQASDYLTKVWVNGTFVGQHEGGYTAFSFDITHALAQEGVNKVAVRVEDNNSCNLPRGKQRWVENNFGCWYVQTTGIWQSVWLEAVEPQYIDSVKMTPDADKGSIKFEYDVRGCDQAEHLSLKTRVTLKGAFIREVQQSVDRAQTTLEIDLLSENIGEWKSAHLWSPHNPNLYEVEFTLLRNGEEADYVRSYFGVRKISIQGSEVLLNGVPLYQRLLLDQGYWKDTHLTAPSVDALIEDIDKAMAFGYNGVRKHQKLEDPRFLYWCDRKGLLVWSEMPAAYEFNDDAVQRFTREWMQAVRQNYNHPSIITWVPFNESWGVHSIAQDYKQQQFTVAIYHLTKSFDAMRPVIVNDGWEHTVSDIITLHDYEERGEAFAAWYADKDEIFKKSFNRSKYAMASGYEYKGQPILISEYGGIAFNSEEGWGYGNQVKTEEQFIERFRSITQAIKQLPYACGFCYTQITDVQQEVNGLMTIDREPKIDPEIIKAINLS